MPTNYKIPKSAGPDPARYAMTGSEDSHQIALFMLAAQKSEQYPELKWLFAIPNGGFRTKSEAAKFKAIGVKSGVSDIFWPLKRGQWSGLFIELKRPVSKGRRQGAATQEQKDFIDFVHKQGYAAMVCVGYEMAWNTLMQYYAWPNKSSEPILAPMVVGE